MSKWTEKKPYKVGFYFWRSAPTCGCFVVEICSVEYYPDGINKSHRLMCEHPDDEDLHTIDDMGGQWSDAPIKLPQPTDQREG